MSEVTGDRVVTENDVEAVVRAVRLAPSRRNELVALLREDAPVHAGRSTTATARIRAYVLAAFADVGLPTAAVPYVLEDLEVGEEPVLLAAAARAVRGFRGPNVHRDAFLDPLLDALRTLSSADELVSFESLRPTGPCSDRTSATLEVLRTVRDIAPWASGAHEVLRKFQRCEGAALGEERGAMLDEAIAAGQQRAVATCCGGTLELTTHMPPRALAPDGILLQDQDGATVSFGALVADGVTVLAFFYTRCPNPRKCSATVTSLGALARGLVERAPEAPIRLAAVSYDGGYDDPARLRRYGLARGMPFGPGVRMYRALEGDELLRKHAGASVGYGTSLVNRHALQLFLLGPGGAVERNWTRQRWDPDEVAEVAVRLANA